MKAGAALGAVRAWTAGLRFRPLGRDYWEPDVSAPYLRAALGVALAPALLAAGFAALGWLAEFLADGPDVDPAAYALEIFVSMLIGLYDLAYAPTLIAFLALWSLRRRSLAAFLVASVLSGLAAAAAAADALGYASTDVVAAVILLNSAMLFLARALSAVRE